MAKYVFALHALAKKTVRNGGKGKINGVLLAIFLVRALETGINRFPQISSYYISLIWGAVLILAMVLNYFTENNIKIRKKS